MRHAIIPCLAGVVCMLATAGCARERPELPATSPVAAATSSVQTDMLPGHGPPSETADAVDAQTLSGAAGSGTASAPAPQEPDGNDDPEDPGAGSVPAHARFERVGRAPLALQRICDLTPFHGRLYTAHANQPLGTDGATVARYVPPQDSDGGTRPFSVAFDWNRPGEPVEGGGAGQGFLRVHAIGGRLYVPDSDPPYNGFGISEGGTEGFVFVSDPDGHFARAQGPHFRPPGVPSPDGGAGASVLPRAYHVLDVIRFRGRLYASTGSVPPGEHAWRGPSPGALHVANPSLSRWTYEVGYPVPYKDGVWRLGFLVRFQDRLYAGIQDYDGREPNDFVVFDPPNAADRITPADMHAVRVTERGASLTLRWYADRGKLYWIALEKDGAGVLRVTTDGVHWQALELPAEVGRPTDVVRFRQGLVVLAERGLVRIDVDPFQVVAAIAEKKSPFAITDAFCAAPLAVLNGALYAGGQRDGALYRLAAAEP